MKTPHSEETPFYFRFSYAYGKHFGFCIVLNYRDKACDIFACNGILFNHKSRRRGSKFIRILISRSSSEFVFDALMPLLLHEGPLLNQGLLLSSHHYTVQLTYRIFFKNTHLYPCSLTLVYGGLQVTKLDQWK